MVAAGAAGEPFRLRTRYGVLALGCLATSTTCRLLHGGTDRINACMYCGAVSAFGRFCHACAASSQCRYYVGCRSVVCTGRCRGLVPSSHLSGRLIANTRLPLPGSRNAISARTWYAATLLSCFLPSADALEQRQVPSTAGYRQGERGTP